MKIVLNGDFGGFGLSKEVKILYMEMLKEQNNMIDFKVVCKGRYDTTALIKNDIDVETDNDIYGISDEDCIMFDEYEVDRTDPLLISCIEKIGLKESSGDHATLYIKDIPKGTLYKINEYDGRETIEYKENDSWLVAT